jgi:hypothetical protein
MKKLLLLMLLLVVYLPYNYVKSEAIPFVVKEEYHQEETFILDTLTIYNPVVEQCDSDPLITASNAKIDTLKLRKKKIRWMALSRDMLKRWNGKLNYGDTVILESGDNAIDGKWVIQDTMNKRYKKRGDLLFDMSVRKSGRWLNVKMIKYDVRNKKTHA